MDKETNFAKIFRDLMDERGLNQMQLANLLEIRQSQVSNLLNGKSLPQFFTIRQICIKLNVSANELLEVEHDG